jgi:hypothetical protein
MSKLQKESYDLVRKLLPPEIKARTGILRRYPASLRNPMEPGSIISLDVDETD